MKRNALLALIASPTMVIASGVFYYTPPPPLADYHERIPAKTALTMLREQRPRAADAATMWDMEKDIDDLTRLLAKSPIDRPAAIKQIDHLLQRNRTGEYRKRYANFLWDVRDLLLSTNLANADAETAEYATWRETLMEVDDGSFGFEPQRDWSLTDAEYQALVDQWKAAAAAQRASLSEALMKSSALTRPHYLVQRGAMAFRQRDFGQARIDFQTVIDQHADSPRAEVARLMLARCAAEQWDPQKKTEEAPVALFEEYLTHYPKGRYAVDIAGWKAGLMRKAGDWMPFIKLIAQQMANTEHPEVALRAAQELDRGLIDMADSVKGQLADYWGEGNPYEEIAAQPIVATRVMHFFLDAQSTMNDERWFRLEIDSNEVVTDRQQPIATIRQIGRKALPLLAEAVTRHRAKHGSDGWNSEHIVMLAWAASEGGQHLQASRLIAGKLPLTDEVLFARTVIFSRAKQAKEAMAAAAQLVKGFPKSPFFRETQFRMATLLKDSGDWVGALMAIENAHEGDNENYSEPVILADQQDTLRLGDELQAWRARLIQLGDLTQLSRLVTDPSTPASLWRDLAPRVRWRLVAEERFEDALQLATFTRQDVKDEWQSRIGWAHYEGFTELREEQWKALLPQMISHQANAKHGATPNAKANALMQLAALWDQHRSELTMHLRDGEIRFDSQHAGSTQLRDATYLGFAPEQAGENMDRRDELWHAHRLWLQAADLMPRTPLAATALEKANESLRRMAELDDTGWQRAFEADYSARSQQLFDRLKRDHVDSPEGKRAVRYTFYALREVERLPNNCYKSPHEAEIVQAMTGVPASTQILYDDYREGEIPAEFVALQKSIGEVMSSVGTAPHTEVFAHLNKLRSELLQLRAPLPLYSSALNDLDDIALLLQVKDLPADQAKAYTSARIDHDSLPADPADPSAPAADFLAFLHRLRAPIESTEKAAVIAQRMADFLQRYPQSPKREAARTRLIVNTVRATLHKCGIGNFDWPQSPWLGYYVHPFIQRDDAPLDVPKVMQLIADYEHDYPQGRYLSEVQLAKALVLLDGAKFGEALRLLTPILQSPTKHDLHYAACMQLAYVFMKLLEPEQRMSVIAALREVPASQPYLDRFMHSYTCGARLMLIKDWVAAELKR